MIDSARADFGTETIQRNQLVIVVAEQNVANTVNSALILIFLAVSNVMELAIRSCEIDGNDDIDLDATSQVLQEAIWPVVNIIMVALWILFHLLRGGLLLFHHIPRVDVDSASGAGFQLLKLLLLKLGKGE
jgi:hypothetical protein